MSTVEGSLLSILRTFVYRGFVIPDYMHKGICLYIDNHVKPGDFLTAVIENNLHESMSRADDNNLRNLLAYPAFFYEHAPSQCWGSTKAMTEWLKMK